MAKECLSQQRHLPFSVVSRSLLYLHIVTPRIMSQVVNVLTPGLSTSHGKGRCGYIKALNMEKESWSIRVSPVQSQRSP